MSDKTKIGDRMKSYELSWSPTLDGSQPIMARIDGKSFSKLTRGLDRPYDAKFSDLMVSTAKYLASQTSARCAYTQSDEISLVYLSESSNSEVFFTGKIQKMISVLASMATAYFNRELANFVPSITDKTAFFDCRVFQLPSKTEAVNCLIWREQDATRNSIQSSARAYFSHKECHEKSGRELLAMLSESGVNWDEYPAFFKRGTYIRNSKVHRRFSSGEVASLPEKHEARKNPDLVFSRNIWMTDPIPKLASIHNRVEVIFDGEDPVVRQYIR